ncbi:ubiquitin 3 binding protein But2 C-terminal domain-containing protein [Xylaria grammica]|nr:ubiquitin 3 binding protein But2 C-terminal domain-containing protein [Xylaria grammica]
MLQKSIILTSALSGASARALTMRQSSGCSFHLRTEGNISAPVSQYGSGQTRAGVNETASSFSVTNGTFTDSQGRGCWWTPPATVLQCDVGQIPEAGFSIACDGTVSHNGQTTFYSCDTGADGLQMIYSEPNGSNCGEITLHADGCYTENCGGSGTATSGATSGASSSTGTLPLGGFTSSWQLTVPTGGGSTYPGQTGTASPGSSGTSTLPLGGFTSSWQFSYPSSSGSTPTSSGNTPPGGASTPTYPGGEGTPPGGGGGGTQTYPGGSTPSETSPTYPGGESTPPGSGSTPAGETTPGYPGGSTPGGGESTATYPGGSTPASETTPGYPGGESTQTSPAGSTPPGETSPGYPGGSTPPSETTATSPGGTTPGYPGDESTQTYPVGTPPGESTPTTYPVGSTPPAGSGSTTPGATPSGSSYPGSSYPGESTPPAGSGSTTPGATPTGSYPGTSSSSSASSTPSETGTPGESCPGYLGDTYQYPHLIIPVDSANADSAPGTSYFPEVSSTISTAFNFDIPASYAGKTCNVVFLFPTQSQLETSSFNFTGSGAVSFARLSTAVSESTSYGSLPAVSESYGQQTLAPGSGFNLTSFDCPAGEAVAFELRDADGDGSTTFRYFQDWNPCPIGLFITAS